MRPIEWLLLFEDPAEGSPADGDVLALGEACPVCGTEAGVWCDVLVAQAGTKIGIVHAKRVGR